MRHGTGPDGSGIPRTLKQRGSDFGVHSDRVAAVVRRELACRCVDSDRVGLFIGHVTIDTAAHQTIADLGKICVLAGLVARETLLCHPGQVAFGPVHVVAGCA